ncbi:hypothetical protein [Bacillus timonensis]|nr:hypothetical protein [Bacillus timonensis]
MDGLEHVALYSRRTLSISSTNMKPLKTDVYGLAGFGLGEKTWKSNKNSS